MPTVDGPRPAHICAELLAALRVSEERSRRRKRDQRPDRIGLGIKRALLEAAIQADPDPDDFEAWLLEAVLRSDQGVGAARAMALQVFKEWELARRSESFRGWIEDGAATGAAGTDAGDRPTRR